MVVVNTLQCQQCPKVPATCAQVQSVKGGGFWWVGFLGIGWGWREGRVFSGLRASGGVPGAWWGGVAGWGEGVERRRGGMLKKKSQCQSTTGTRTVARGLRARLRRGCGGVLPRSSFPNSG